VGKSPGGKEKCSESSGIGESFIRKINGKRKKGPGGLRRDNEKKKGVSGGLNF